MPVITLPPVIVDPVNFSRPSGNYEQPPYEFQVGNNIYLVFLNKQVPVTHHISVYLSTDFGATWTAQDEANAPFTLGNGLVCFQQAGAIDICFLTGGGAFCIVQFSTGTNTWGAPTAAASVGENQYYFYRQTGGDYVVVFRRPGNIAYIKNVAGVWDAGATNLVAIDRQIFGGAVTSADVAFVFAAPAIGGSAALYRIDASMVATGPFALTNPWSNLTRPSVKIFGADSVAVAQIPSSGGSDVVVEIGTPLSSPVMTRYPIFTKPLGTEMETYATLIIGSDGKLNVFWVRIDYTTTPIIDELDYSIFDGVSAWSAPIQFYDETTNPPANGVADPIHQFIHSIDGLQLADGTWVMAVALETLDAGITHCTGFALINPIPPVPGCPTIYVARQPQPDAPAPPPPPGWVI